MHLPELMHAQSTQSESDWKLNSYMTVADTGKTVNCVLLYCSSIIIHN